jgi:hypothetical protein
LSIFNQTRQIDNAPGRCKNGQLATETHPPRVIARVRAAVEAHVAADRLAAYVGQGPLIDTTAGSSLLAVQHIDFAQDPDHADQRFERDKVRAIVYWRRPVQGDDPHVVGIQVGDGDAACVFVAIILSPD